MKAVYVDTSVLLPLLNDRDSDHSAVKSAFDFLISQRTEMVMSSYTASEAGALVRDRLGVESFRALGEVLHQGATIRWVDEALHREAWARVEEGPRKGPSLVDWTAFLVMRHLGLTTALAIDGHFNDQGFETLPQIPTPV